jgi:prolyl 4-hydroxylase
MTDVVIFQNFISESDCDYLIEKYKDKVSKSIVVGGGIHSSRNSSTFYLPNEDPIIKTIRYKIHKLFDVPEDHIEPLQFLCYKKGERYLYHYDLLPGDNVPNQRVHTVLVYLNTLNVNDGGATSFFYLKQKVTPEKGKGIWFKNLNDDGSHNRLSLHSGEEILKDDVVKYALNIWIRQAPYIYI